MIYLITYFPVGQDCLLSGVSIMIFDLSLTDACAHQTDDLYNINARQIDEAVVSYVH